MKRESPAVLIVDDEEDIREALGSYLEALGYDTERSEAAEQALQILERKPYDLVITDIKLPGMDGIELFKSIKRTTPETSVIVITGYGNIPTALEALQFGADDYLLKPFNLQALQHTVGMIFEKKRLESENLAYRARLEHKVQERSLEIRQADINVGQTFFKTIYVFGNALESRETYLHGRTERITIQAYYTAQELNWDKKQIAPLLFGAPTSDIGKLALPESVLLKTDPLSTEELELVRSHVQEGVQIVADLAHLRDVIPIVQLHHERYDGSGYPFGLKGEEIPGTARLVAICDSFDAMTHPRPWRPAKPVDQALEELRNLAGKAYDPEMIEAFLAAVNREKLDELIGSKPTALFYELTLQILTSPEIWPE